MGDVVSGIAVIALLGLLFFCLRHRRGRDEFDGNFDPDRVVSYPTGGGTLLHVDLGEETEIAPYPDWWEHAPVWRKLLPRYIATLPHHLGRVTPLKVSYPQAQTSTPRRAQYVHDATSRLAQPTPAPSINNTSSGHETKERETIAGCQGLGLATQ
ncbi:hypothetical protein EDB19DRAFT_1832012 [Suillus lakei]|nr:hypothetical protein EDB19DRAFT_1832012 [Suillus lakei]